MYNSRRINEVVCHEEPETSTYGYDEDYINDMLESYLGLATKEKNNFDAYINQCKETIKHPQGLLDLLHWWSNHDKGLQNFNQWLELCYPFKHFK